MNTVGYKKEVESIAKDILNECLEHGQDIGDMVHETVDGHEWIIYTRFHSEVVECASYTDAYLDCYSHEDLGRMVAEKGPESMIQTQAYFALEHDVREAVCDLAKDMKEELETKASEIQEELAWMRRGEDDERMDQLEKHFDELEQQIEALEVVA